QLVVLLEALLELGPGLRHVAPVLDRSQGARQLLLGPQLLPQQADAEFDLLAPGLLGAAELLFLAGSVRAGTTTGGRRGEQHQDAPPDPRSHPTPRAKASFALIFASHAGWSAPSRLRPRPARP